MELIHVWGEGAKERNNTSVLFILLQSAEE